MAATILIVDDEKNTREGLAQVLGEEYDVYTAANAEEAFPMIENERFDVILTDLRMAGKSGLKVIDFAMAQKSRPICIMMTAYGNVETAVEAMKHGAFDFLTKPVNVQKLEIIIKRALQSRKTEEEVVALHKRLDQKYSFSGIIGNSLGLKKVVEQIKLVAPSRASVLITGETGSGKELIAQAIHQNSERSRAPFVAVHCAALSANLLESELFGHEKGAFTGASEKRIGRFEYANGGTLFLDEIGEIDAAVQVKLLRFLETRTFERLGSVKPISVDVRLVCATNRNLDAMVKAGTFREDLFYRLNVVNIHLPPLHERMDDIPVLIDHYLKKFSEENGIGIPKIQAKAMQVLQHYRWPGNIRELRNFCENLVIMKRDAIVDVEDLDAKYREPQPVMSLSPSGSLSREENEKQLIKNALMNAAGNRTKAANMLGISRRTLHRKLLLWPDLE